MDAIFGRDFFMCWLAMNQVASSFLIYQKACHVPDPRRAAGSWLGGVDVNLLVFKNQ